jgi:DNA-binding transcriptional LysR family regulator
MTALSRDLGVALFERTPRGLRLTDSAHALIAHCEAVFERLAEAQTELEAIAGGVGGRLRLGSFPTATVAFTARAIERFRRLHPGVELRFADGEPYESVARLKERELDIAVIFEFDHWTAATDYDGASVCDDRDIECVELFDDPFHVVMPRGHPLAGREQVELPDLADERVLGAPFSCSPWGRTSGASAERPASSPRSSRATARPTSPRCRRSWPRAEESRSCQSSPWARRTPARSCGGWAAAGSCVTSASRPLPGSLAHRSFARW